ncbi:MAG: hypothetical protein DCF22_12235 [Leptolyngbya sp.]|nr:MAG: hypothetical protein DCF22_12235 [Leptolyngbya sp.]
MLEHSPKADDVSEAAKPTSTEATPALRRPLARPVSRPATPPASTPAIAKVTPTVLPASKPEPVVVSDTPDTAAPANSEPDPETQATLRQHPIPPPSEPKQYRAIGLVRGRYTAVEDEFTRGEMVTPDGTLIKAVLLGRVMSLVRNHIDLEKDHLWVVYPRTREGEPDIHLQIVGIWEPETLKRSDAEGQDAEEQDTEVEEPKAPTDADLHDRYFSIRGEIVYVAQDETYLVVKIQQAPRKNSQKAKAFKLPLRGKLENPRQVGYFWDLNIKLIGVALTITDGTCIGLAPPKKRSKDGDDRGRRRPQFGRRPPNGGAPRSSSAAPPRPATGGSRPVPPPKPVKRSEPASEG